MPNGYARESVLRHCRRYWCSAAIQVLSVCSAFSLVGAARCRAQATDYVDDANLLETSGTNTTAVPPRLVIGQLQTADSAAPAPPQAATPNPTDGWHLAVSPYLWFPGVHGTATGPNGGGLSFRASPGDLLSHFRFGLMGAAEASRKRFVLTGDVLWIRLRDDKSIPFPGLGATSASMKATEFFLTPKIGVRVIDQEKFKITALTGLRYWHLGESLNFNPSLLGLNFSGSQDFVDPLVGGRIEAAITQKIVVNVLGDVGGWGTGSELEYQWAGLLGYRVNAAWTLQAGYRYLYVDKRSSRGVVFNVTTAGVVFGITLNLK